MLNHNNMDNNELLMKVRLRKQEHETEIAKKRDILEETDYIMRRDLANTEQHEISSSINIIRRVTRQQSWNALKSAAKPEANHRQTLHQLNSLRICGAILISAANYIVLVSQSHQTL